MKVLEKRKLNILSFASLKVWEGVYTLIPADSLNFGPGLSGLLQRVVIVVSFKHKLLLGFISPIVLFVNTDSFYSKFW